MAHAQFGNGGLFGTGQCRRKCDGARLKHTQWQGNDCAFGSEASALGGHGHAVGGIVGNAGYHLAETDVEARSQCIEQHLVAIQEKRVIAGVLAHVVVPPGGKFGGLSGIFMLDGAVDQEVNPLLVCLGAGVVAQPGTHGIAHRLVGVGVLRCGDRVFQVGAEFLDLIQGRCPQLRAVGVEGLETFIAGGGQACAERTRLYCQGVGIAVPMDPACSQVHPCVRPPGVGVNAPANAGTRFEYHYFFSCFPQLACSRQARHASADDQDAFRRGRQRRHRRAQRLGSCAACQYRSTEPGTTGRQKTTSFHRHKSFL